MKKILLIASVVISVVACKKEEKETPCPSIPVAQYSDTKFYLTNSSGRGEADTIVFLMDASMEVTMTSLVDSFADFTAVDVSGPELTIYPHMNSANTKYYEGTGTFGNKELLIYWFSANSDTTDIQSFYSVYSQCRIN